MMDRTRKDPTGGSPFGRGPREGKGGGDPSGLGPREDHPAEVPSGVSSAGRNFAGPQPVPPVGSPATDPELEADLGAEFELRGDQVEGELETARREAATNLETAQRLQAEFDNYRKRVARDAEDAAKRAGQRVIEELLPALDNLERALAHVEAGGDGAQLTDGVRMVLQQVLDVLGKEGVEVIDPRGGLFDFNEHQAVSQVEDASVPEGTVLDVYQRGYRMHGRVLRPASVVVSTGGPAPEE